LLRPIAKPAKPSQLFHAFNGPPAELKAGNGWVLPAFKTEAKKEVRVVMSESPGQGENQQAGRTADFWEQLLNAATGRRLKWFLLLPFAGVVLALFGAWLHL
jgi:hypothetical protein